MARKTDLDVVDIDETARDEPDDLEKMKRESAGKDRKISELQNELRELKEKMTTGAPNSEVQGGDVDHASEVPEVLATIREKAGELKALEESLNQREAALAYAVEKGISIPLSLGNSHRLAEFKTEVDGLYEDIRKGAMRAFSTNKKMTAARPGTPGSSGPVNTGDGLTLEHLGKMSGAELSRIPDRILEKLRGG